MSRKLNLILGLTNAVWSAAVSLIVIPFYLRYLGIDSFGLIGFLAALQAVLTILDLGLAPTMSREVARCRASNDLTEARSLLHTLALLYAAAAVVIAIGILVSAPFIAGHWLQSARIPPETLRDAILLMGVVIALRWPSAVYGGVLVGDDKLAQSSLVGIGAATLANFGGVAVLAWVSPSIEALFAWQAGVAAVTVFVLRHLAWQAIGRASGARFDVNALRRVWRFSAGLGIASLLGVIFMQADKVVLSRLVSLEALGIYTLAGTISRTLYIILSPTFNLVFPRLTPLWTNGQQDTLIRYYAVGSRLLATVIVPVAIYVSIFALPLIELWTRNTQLAASVAPLVPWLMAGTVFNGFMHFPYALQLAAGQSRLPAFINLSLLFVFIPLLTILTLRFGIVGAAAAWAGLNAGYVVVGTIVTHRFVLRGYTLRWLFRDIGPVLPIAGLVAGVGGWSVRMSVSSIWPQLALGALLALAACVLSCLSYPPLYALIIEQFRLVSRKNCQPNIGSSHVA